MLADRIKNIVPSGTMAINARVFELRAEGKEIINLSVGEPDFNTPEAAKQAGCRAIEENRTRYDKVAGLVELREEICRKLKAENHLDYTIDRIVVTNGAKQGVTNTCLTMLNDGDEVLIPAPYYVSYPEIVKLAGGVPVFVETKPENDFKPTAAELEAAITERTKMLILCNPSNPLGTVLSREELTEIAEICLRHKIYIMSDEVYEAICFAEEFVSVAEVLPEMQDWTILVNGLSKSAPMTGWRIGYTASNAEIAKGMTALQGHITTHPSTVSQWAGVTAMAECAEYTKQMRQAFRERRDAAVEFLQTELPEVSFVNPQGAFYIFADITCVQDALLETASEDGRMPHSGTTSLSMEFAMRLLNEYQTAIVPGIVFGQEGFVRIAYAADKEYVLEGLRRIRRMVKAICGEE